jgi:hypothetical protein
VLVFASSDKGGTGRSVTSCNIAYHLAQQRNVAYLDFDFGSPTAGAIFEIVKAERGVEGDGLHSYVEGAITDPRQIDVWRNSGRADLRKANSSSGRLVFFPGNIGGAEFSSTTERINRCVELFSTLDNEFDVCVVDLSAGRSHALYMALAATATSALKAVTARWLVFHRWSRQHVLAANGLVYGDRGMLDVGRSAGHDRNDLLDRLRFVRTAVPDLKEPSSASNATQATWLHTVDDELKKLALKYRLGRSSVLGTTPMEPVLQWREQIVSDTDVSNEIANAETVAAFRELARKLTHDPEWEGL